MYVTANIRRLTTTITSEVPNPSKDYIIKENSNNSISSIVRRKLGLEEKWTMHQRQ